MPTNNPVLIKGFVSIEELIDNTFNTTAPVGELSKLALTYKKEIATYNDTDHPTLRLTSFTTEDQVTHDVVEVTDAQTLQVFEIINHLQAYAAGHIRPYDEIDVINSLSSTFGADANNFALGEFIDNGNIALPEWISWTNTSENDNKLRIWLSDTAFRAQYDEFEITIVPPFIDVDHLHTNYNSLVTEIGLLNTPELVERMDAAKQGHPETYFKILNFKLYNKDDDSLFVETEWGVLVYGKAGDNIDAIKDALEAYILNISGHLRSEWVVILPDIFKRTEFIIVPRWDQVSIPNLSVNSVLYSSMVDPNEAKTFAQDNINLYPDVWVGENLTILPFDYKALTMLIIDGTDNIAGKEHIDEIFPDYVPVSSTTLDFNRMEIFTRDWLLLLEEALIAAETIDSFSSVPEPLRKVEKLEVLYVGFLYDNVNYLVAAKTNSFY